MDTMITPAQRTLFAAAAIAASALGLSVLASSFLPADPHVEIARAQAVLDRVERVQHAQTLQQGNVTTAAATTIVR
jgi:hypothetical protein